MTRANTNTVKETQADDYLDSAAAFPNYLNGKPYSDEYKGLAQNMWSQLPMYKDKGKLREVLACVSQNQVTILVSGTGSGKTVIVPKLAVKYGIVNHLMQATDGRSRCVAITNPKAATTLENASFGAKCLDVELGAEVGALYRGAPQSYYDARRAHLLYLTDGYLLNFSRNDPLFDGFSAVILDEAHERPVPTDFLLLALRRALSSGSRPDLRLVIMSATIDTEPFVSYFSKVGCTVGVVSVSGASNHPVRSLFLKRDLAPPPPQGFSSATPPAAYLIAGSMLAARILEHNEDIAKKASDVLERIDISSHCASSTKKISRASRQEGAGAEEPGKGHIIFFVPTSRDAAQGCRLHDAHCSLTPSSHRLCEPVACRPLYSKLPVEEQQLAVHDPVPPIDRKVIYATNIAESSVTVKGLDYVIDSGMELDNTFDPLTHGSRIEKQFTTQAQVRQRLGRAGRLRPGTAIHLYTAKQFCQMPTFPDPTILQIDITDELINMLRSVSSSARAAAPAGKDGVLASPLSSVLQDLENLLTPPKPVQVVAALSVMHFYRIIDIKGAHDKRLMYSEMAYDKLANATSYRVLDGLEGNLTSLGRFLASVMIVYKMSFWNALLFACGMFYDCPKECGALASLFESTAGDIRSLFVDQEFSSDSNQQTSLAPTNQLLQLVSDKGPFAGDATLKRVIKALPTHSDHAALLHILTKVYPALAKRVGKGQQPRQRSIGGLNLETWEKAQAASKAVLDRLKSFNVSDAQRIKRMSPLLNMHQLHADYLVQQGGNATKKQEEPILKDNLSCALLAARLYHIAAPRGQNADGDLLNKLLAKGKASANKEGGSTQHATILYDTLVPTRKTSSCELEPDFIAFPSDNTNLVLYESLSLTARGPRLRTVHTLKASEFPMNWIMI